MLEVKDLSKRYGNFTALSNISFSAKAGEVTAFLGPNGAGKTTTMRIICGFLNADKGDIVFTDKKDTDVHELKRQIGYLPENNPLYSNLRVDEYMLFHARLSQLDGVINSSELLEVAEKCGLNSVMTKTINSLSKGYKQRVGLAKAMIGNPKYLVLDEPTTGLDPNQKEETLKLIKSLAKDKVIIFSSHILAEVDAIADKVVIINKGEIVAEGKSASLLKKHNSGGVVVLKTNISKVLLDKGLASVKNTVSTTLLSANKKTGYNTFEIIVEKDDDITVEIFKVAVKNKWTVSELFLKQKGLEELFKDLTK